MMHELFQQVLKKRDLSKAGDLFNIDNEKIVDDLSQVIAELEEISSQPDYLRNDNDQSVVEICITRVTSAIRETNSIESHSVALVSLLKSCLAHNLRLPGPGAGQEEPSHVKIAADLMSFIFLNYTKRSVMELALPVAVDFLECGNKDLCRNLISYLALAAIDNADILAKEESMKKLVVALLEGQNGLIRIVCKVQESAPDCLAVYTEQLVPQLKEDLSSTDQLALAQSLHSTALKQWDPFVLHVPMFISLLSNSAIRAAVLDILAAIATNDVTCLVDHVPAIVKVNNESEEGEKGVVTVLAAKGWNQEQLLAIYKHLVDLLDTPDVRDVMTSRTLTLMTSLRRETVTAVETEAVLTYGRECGLEEATIANISQILKSPPSGLGSIEEEDENTAASTPTDNTVPSAATNSPVREPESSAEKPRDTVQHFCEKHLSTIKTYITKVLTSVPIPDKCTVTGTRTKKKFTLQFTCTGCSPHCLYRGHHFTLTTKLPNVWAHLIFLNEQSKSPCALKQEDPGIMNIKRCWQECRLDQTLGSFTRLVTSSFPNTKDQESVIKELYSIRFFDLFVYNVTQKQWICFVCHSPEKVGDLLQDGHPAMEGQLQEKKGKWRFFKRWKTRYFTLSGSHITYSKKDSCKSSLPLSKIQSVRTLRKGRDIPKAFEIFADNQTYLFRPKDGKAEQWVQCLQLAMAQSQEQEDGGMTS